MEFWLCTGTIHERGNTRDSVHGAEFYAVRCAIRIVKDAELADLPRAAMVCLKAPVSQRDVGLIVVGGLTKAGNLLLNPTRTHMEANLLPIFKNKVKLIFSELKESDAAILGASALVW